MERNTLLIGLGAMAALLIGAYVLVSGPNTAATPHTNTELVVYKSPNCGCCGIYVTYLERQGFIVTVHDQSDMNTIKQEVGVPSNVRSCHTAFIDGYVVEGHVPTAAITALLEQEPEITGIALPGMPSGSPGMPGTKYTEWLIYGFDDSGNTRTFMRM